MMCDIHNINRLCIYVFSDADMVADRYALYLLDQLKMYCTKLLIVCNDQFSLQGLDRFVDAQSQLMQIQRPSYGFALNQFGRDELQAYDEVILMDSSLMGAVFPLDSMFQRMNTRDVDIWGVVNYWDMSEDAAAKECVSSAPTLETCFIVANRKVFSSEAFFQYWMLQDETDGEHSKQANLTRFFEMRGFHCEAYINDPDLKRFAKRPLMDIPVTLVRDYHCPFFKRDIFFRKHEENLAFALENQAAELMAYLAGKNSYDVDMIWENVLRTAHMSDIKYALRLNYVLHDDVKAEYSSKTRLALVIHTYYPDLIDYCYRYALSMPPEADIYITTCREDQTAELQKLYTGGVWHTVTIVKVSNRGRDVSALLVGISEYLQDYDLVCFVHDKKVNQLDWNIMGSSYSTRCFDNLLGSRELVSQIIHCFECQPRLGLLFPPPPYHGDYYFTIGNAWGPNYQNTKDLLNRMKVTVPISEDKPPIAPLGTMFWFRPTALNLLFQYGWTYDDFPQEPNEVDGTILHAIERAYPYFAQQAGYYSAWVLSDTQARNEWNNLYYLLNAVNIEAFKRYGLCSHVELLRRMETDCAHQIVPDDNEISLKRGLKNWLRSMMPRTVWEWVKRLHARIIGG